MSENTTATINILILGPFRSDPTCWSHFLKAKLVRFYNLTDKKGGHPPPSVINVPYFTSPTGEKQTAWCGTSIVWATLLLLKAAFKNGTQNSLYCIVSGDSIPVCSVQALRETKLTSCGDCWNGGQFFALTHTAVGKILQEYQLRYVAFCKVVASMRRQTRDEELHLESHIAYACFLACHPVSAPARRVSFFSVVPDEIWLPFFLPGRQKTQNTPTSFMIVPKVNQEDCSPMRIPGSGTFTFYCDSKRFQGNAPGLKKFAVAQGYKFMRKCTEPIKANPPKLGSLPAERSGRRTAIFPPLKRIDQYRKQCGFPKFSIGRVLEALGTLLEQWLVHYARNQAKGNKPAVLLSFKNIIDFVSAKDFPVSREWKNVTQQTVRGVIGKVLKTIKFTENHAGAERFGILLYRKNA